MADGAARPLRLRVQFTKEGVTRYLSHSEYMRTLMISARRAGLPLEYAGINMGRMKISLSPPLPIGITSECELIDFNLTSYVPAAEAQRLFGTALPGDIRAVRCQLMGGDARPVGKVIDTAEFRVELPAGACAAGELRDAIESFLAEQSIPYERVQPRRTRTVDVRAGVHALEVLTAEGESEGLVLRMVVDDGISGTTKPWEVIEVLAGTAGIPEEDWKLASVHRTGLFARRGERLVSPMDIGMRRAPAGGGAGGGEC